MGAGQRGLAITSQRVRPMGGTVSVKSEPARGPTFTLTVPLTPLAGG